MVFPVIMYGCESWTIKKAECRRTDVFEQWCWKTPVSPERLLMNHAKTPGFLASGGEFNPGPETRLDCSEVFFFFFIRSELLCNKVLLKYKGDRESF